MLRVAQVRLRQLGLVNLGSPIISPKRLHVDVRLWRRNCQGFYSGREQPPYLARPAYLPRGLYVLLLLILFLS